VLWLLVASALRIGICAHCSAVSSQWSHILRTRSGASFTDDARFIFPLPGGWAGPPRPADHDRPAGRHVGSPSHHRRRINCVVTSWWRRRIRTKDAAPADMHLATSPSMRLPPPSPPPSSAHITKHLHRYGNRCYGNDQHPITGEFHASVHIVYLPTKAGLFDSAIIESDSFLSIRIRFSLLLIRAQLLPR